MNPLTLVKRIQKINSTEASLGVSEEASWHAKYKESAYVFVGGIPFDLTEGDLLAVFSQYGEIVDVNLVRDKGTGKSKGFAFLAYEDQRSTILAVDNLNGASILGRIVRVDHVSNYKKKQEEDEEKEQQKREARGVCRAFQRGECNRGAACKFSHNEERSANTGWGPKDSSSRWDHDKYEGPSKNHRKSAYGTTDRIPDSKIDKEESKLRPDVKDGGRSSADVNDEGRKSHLKQSESIVKVHERRGIEKQPEWQEKEPNLKEDEEREMSEKRSGRHDSKPNSKDGRDRRGSGKRSRYDEDDAQENTKEDQYRRGNENQSGRYETEQNHKVEQGSRRSEKHSRYNGNESEQNLKEIRDRRGSERHLRYNGDETEQNMKENRDRRGSEKCSRYDADEAEPNSKQDQGMRGSEKHSRYSSSLHKGEEVESPHRRVRT